MTNMSVVVLTDWMRPVCGGVRSIMTTTAIATPEIIEGYKEMVGKFKRYAPEWDGAITPETAVRLVRDVIDKAKPEDSGALLSQFGNDRWL